MKKYYIYVIKSSEGYIYKGMTEDLELRIKQHNEEKLSFWTKRGTDWQLDYSKVFDDKKEALKRERWLKTGVGREFLSRILENK
jgi:putative endonuclease